MSKTIAVFCALALSACSTGSAETVPVQPYEWAVVECGPLVVTERPGGLSTFWGGNFWGPHPSTDGFMFNEKCRWYRLNSLVWCWDEIRECAPGETCAYECLRPEPEP